MRLKQIVKRFLRKQIRKGVRKFLSVVHSRDILHEVLTDPIFLTVFPVEEFYWRAFQALSFNGIDGDYAEFGCHHGGSFVRAYRASRTVGYNCKLWAFDSFCGLPPQESEADSHPKWVEGDYSAGGVEEFHKTCRSCGINETDYTAVTGFYHETLEKMSDSDPPTNLCLAYIDCDLYASTKSVLSFLLPRLKHGMIIAFDDYHTWSSTQIAGERKAYLEFFRNHPDWVLVPYQSIGWHGMSFVVERRDLHEEQKIGPDQVMSCTY